MSYIQHQAWDYVITVGAWFRIYLRFVSLQATLGIATRSFNLYSLVHQPLQLGLQFLNLLCLESSEGKNNYAPWLLLEKTFSIATLFARPSSVRAEAAIEIKQV